MSRTFRTRVFALLAALALLWGAACAQSDARHDQVFDASQDAGRLTARFLYLLSPDGEKSGDATILTSPDGKVMLLDAGEPGCADQVIAALQALGVSRIDYLVASHPHVDHVGGFAEVLRTFPVGAVYTSFVEYPTAPVAAYLAEIQRQGIPHIRLAQGDTFAFGDQVTVEVFHPSAEIEYYEGYPDNSTQFVNDLSLVLRFAYGDSSMLFGGDVYATMEQIADKYGERLQSDVFKVGHHGAATSSSKPYREAISPKIAVMISDTLSDLGIYQKYRKMDSDVYITYFDGSVRVSTAGDGAYDVLTKGTGKPTFWTDELHPTDPFKFQG
ncbi:MAG TPA: MBL fold metallo-hydrolase [Clostridia bacterium]|nr:MBL fold metallo-hydrolase [Clostridia bacterium]